MSPTENKDLWLEGADAETMIQSEDNSRGKDMDLFFEYLKKLD